MFQALQLRDFRLLWAGGLISSLGSWLLVLAIPAHVFLVTGSLRATGLTLAAEYLPMLLLGPVAGVCTDRWDRRRLMVATNLFCAAAVATMLLGLSPGRYWVLYLALPTAVAIGAFGSMSLLIPQTTAPRVIPNAVLGRVSAVFLTGEAAATLLTLTAALLTLRTVPPNGRSLIVDSSGSL